MERQIKLMTAWGGLAHQMITGLTEEEILNTANKLKDMVEKERKFLPKDKYSLQEELVSMQTPDFIQQGYLMIQDNQHLRVRVVDNSQGFLCMKIGSGIERQEFEYEIPLEDAKEMMDNCLYKLDKTRFTTSHNSNHVDVDFYMDGTVVIEIEFKKELGPDDIPEYCGEEITGEEKYSNIFLAKKFSMDLSKLRKEDFIRR